MKLLALTVSILLKSCSGDSAPPVQTTGEKQAQIYAGITTIREKARCAGYFNRLDDFKTRVVAPEGVSADGLANYINYQGGKVAGYYDVDSDVLVLVDQPNLTEITEHEATHRVYKFNDEWKYEATKTHSTNVPFDLPGCK